MTPAQTDIRPRLPPEALLMLSRASTSTRWQRAYYRAQPFESQALYGSAFAEKKIQRQLDSVWRDDKCYAASAAFPISGFD